MATVIAGRSSSGSGVTPPTTLVPPPYGISAAPRSRARREELADGGGVRRAGRRRPGTRPSRPLRSAIQSGRLWPRAWRIRSTGRARGRPAGVVGERSTAAGRRRRRRGARPASAGPARARSRAAARASSATCGGPAPSSIQPFQRRTGPWCPIGACPIVPRNGAVRRRARPRWGRPPRCTPAAASRGRTSRGVGLDEPVLVRADLVDVDVVVAGVRVGLDRRRRGVSRSGPQTTRSPIISSVTIFASCSKWAGLGSS